MVHVQISRRRKRKQKRKIPPLWLLGVIVLVLIVILAAQTISYILLGMLAAGLPLAYWLGYRRSLDEIARLKRIATVNRQVIETDAVSAYPPELTGKLPANTDYGKRGEKARATRDRILSDPRSGARSGITRPWARQ